MAFRSSQELLALALAEAVNTAADVKARSVELRDFTAANSVSANLLIEYCLFLINRRDRLNVIKVVPGLAAYARAQYDDPAYDVAAEFTAMLAKVGETIDWIVVAVPKDASGYMLVAKLTSTGQTIRAFTTAQTANLRTELDELIATIS